MFQRKTLKEILASGQEEGRRLRRELSALDLVALGIGCIVGAGIFVVTGIGASMAGPAVIVSFAVAGLACAAAALCYAEMASMLPISGSAYTYAYASFGEFLAWIIGWDLILEYTVAAGAVASGWSGYLCENLRQLGIEVPKALSASPAAGGIVDLPAVLVIALLTGILVVGIRESSSVNKFIVALKLGVILFVIALGAFAVKGENFTPFNPFGWSRVLGAAAIMFFAFIGFDAVSTTAEEARNPQRDLPIGILGSLAVCTVLYMGVAAVLTGMLPHAAIHGPVPNEDFLKAPIAWAFSFVGKPWASWLISAGAIAGITSVLLVLLIGQPRILFAMSRDGLLPTWTAKTHPRFGTPYVTTLATGLLVALLAGFLPIEELAVLVNIGTLLAFVLVCLGVLVLRYTRPEYPRAFRTPLVWLVSLVGVGSCVAMMTQLPATTWIRLLVWLGLGLVVYFAWGIRHSKLRRRPKA
jgi:APA family basic amino acid/polyamine antiporter